MLKHSSYNKSCNTEDEHAGQDPGWVHACVAFDAFDALDALDVHLCPGSVCYVHRLTLTSNLGEFYELLRRFVLSDVVGDDDCE